MHGRPVWLASLSRTDKKREIIATGLWTPAQIQEGATLLRRSLFGVGDMSQERLFRMNITLCLHRACLPLEVASLPRNWHKAEWGMAGGPVETLWQNVPSSPSCSPCASPRRHVEYAERPDLWLPLDCGACEACVARAQVRRIV